MGIKFLTDAQIVDPIIDPVFDLSNILPKQSVFGEFLHIIFGYVDNPSMAQLITYLTVLIGLSIGLYIAKKI